MSKVLAQILRVWLISVKHSSHGIRYFLILLLLHFLGMQAVVARSL